MTGASGFVGRQLVADLARIPGAKVRCLTRSPELSPHESIVQIKGDLQSGQGLGDFLFPHAALIHLAYINSQHPEDNLASTRNLLEAAIKAGISKFIHCSTAMVVGDANTDWVDESTPCQPAPGYQAVKLRVEQILLEGGRGCFPVAVLRPTAVFGPGGKNLVKIIRDLREEPWWKSKLRKSLLRGRALNLVSVENVSQALLFLAQLERPIDQQIFYLSDDEDHRNQYSYVASEIERVFAGKSAGTIPQQVHPLATLIFALAKRGQRPKRRYSSAKIMAWGFKKEQSFDERLRRYLEWVFSQQKRS